MPTYYSPTGNAEVWKEMPDGYLTPEEWRAAHPAPALTQSELDAIRITEIKEELARLDAESVRPLRAILHNSATDEDTAKIAELEAQAKMLREELATLEE